MISAAESVCEITVASATPETSIFSDITKKRLSITFKTPEIVRYIRGDLVSPAALKIAEPKLYIMLEVMPKKYILIYDVERSIASSGVPINIRIFLAPRIPTIVRITPLIADIGIDV